LALSAEANSLTSFADQPRPSTIHRTRQHPIDRYSVPSASICHVARACKPAGNTLRALWLVVASSTQTAARVCSSVYSSVHCQTFRQIHHANGLAPLGCAVTSLAGAMSRPLSGVEPHRPTNYSPRIDSSIQALRRILHSHSCGSRLPATVHTPRIIQRNPRYRLPIPPVGN